MNGCEYIKCPDWFNGVCNSTADYVNKATGENMCCRNDSAIPRYQYLEISEHELEYQDKISQLESALADSEALLKIARESLDSVRRWTTFDCVDMGLIDWTISCIDDRKFYDPLPTKQALASTDNLSDVESEK